MNHLATKQYELYIDPQEYAKKPTQTEVQRFINRRITNNKVKATPSEIADEVGNKGKTMLPAIMSGGRNNKNFVEQSVYAIDFDNDTYLLNEEGKKVKGRDGKFIKIKAEEENYDSLDDILNDEFIQENASFIYKTFSYQDEWERFRVVFFLNRPLNSADEATRLNKELCSIFPNIDSSAKDPARIFYGGIEAIEVNYENILSIDLLLVEEQAEEEQESFIYTFKNPVPQDITDKFDEEVERYIKLDEDNLTEEENWISVLHSLLNSIYQGELTQEQAEKYCAWIALGDREWAYKNVERLRYELKRKTIPTSNWTFANKVREVIKSFETPKKQTNFYSYDDTGNAERFIDKFGDKFLFNTTSNSWMVYNGKIWKLDDTKEAYKKATEISKEIAKEPVYVSDISDEKLVASAEKAKQKHLHYSRSNRGKNSLLNDASSIVATNDDKFDQVGNIINLQNGYYDLDKDEFKPHDKSLYLTLIGNTKFDDTAQCPRWIQFVNETFLGDVELIHYVQRVVGYALSNSTVEKKMFILYGDTDTGKSVFVDTIRHIMGTYTEDINPEALMTNKNKTGDSASPSLAKLKKARFVSTSEVTDEGHNRKLDGSLVKRVTGNDPVTARFLNQNEITYIPEFKIFMATNYRPIVSSDDNAMWNRLAIIPFENVVQEYDHDLTEKLIREDSGILNWMIQGYREYKQHGLKHNEPEAVTRQRLTYRKELDVLGQFIDERCELDPQHSVKSSEIYSAYKEWAEHTGERVVSNRKFSMDLGKRFKKEQRRDANYIVGLQLKI